MKKQSSRFIRFTRFFFSFLLLISVVIYFLIGEKPYTGIHPPTQGNTVTIFLIDGLSKSIFKELLAAGKLPHLQQLIEKSTYTEHGIGAFPSMTGYAFYPFITGEDATKSGILGLRWFDRSRDVGNLRHYVGRTNIHMNTDIKPQPLTIFEKYRQYYTASFNTYLNRGVHHAEMSSWAHSTSKYQSLKGFKLLRNIPFLGKNISKNHFQHESLVMEKAISQLRRNPKAQWVTFTAPDASNHLLGTTAEYYRLLTHIDSLIGNFIVETKRLGQDSSRMICIITDHGISDVFKNLNIPAELVQKHGIDLERGPATHLYSSDLTEKLTDFMEKDGYFVINGNLSAYIYLRDKGEKPTPAHWRNRQSFEALEQYAKGESIIKIVAATEGVELVACRKDDSTVSIFNNDGQGDIIFNKNKGYQYRVTGQDPLGYTNTPDNKVGKGYFTADEWLKMSLETEYPDAIYRLYQLMMAENVGDLLVTSKKGYDLAADYELFVGNYKGGHGGLRGELLDVPYILYKPNSATHRVPYMRAEDAGKAIIDYLSER
jgi:predicted AlkP superfamily pyrophosphatase or phosphodiesterase